MRRLFLIALVLFSYNLGFGQSMVNDSTLNGFYSFYHHDTIKVKGYFKKTKRHKIWTWYNADASIHKQIKYKHGKPLWTIYFENNKVWLKVNRYGKKRIIRACDCRVN
jgi:antitoxin component YwqK of YwqJK toxin-antitoxin module